jgi:hypothetical protein
MRLRTLIVAPICHRRRLPRRSQRDAEPERANLDASARQGVPGKFVTLGDGITHYDVARALTAASASCWCTASRSVVHLGLDRHGALGRRVSRRTIRRVRAWVLRSSDVAYTADLYDRQLVQLLDSLVVARSGGYHGAFHGWIRDGDVRGATTRTRSLADADRSSRRGEPSAH